jgi:hypothetical protein
MLPLSLDSEKNANFHSPRCYSCSHPSVPPNRLEQTYKTEQAHAARQQPHDYGLLQYRTTDQS